MALTTHTNAHPAVSEADEQSGGWLVQTAHTRIVAPLPFPSALAFSLRSAPLSVCMHACMSPTRGEQWSTRLKANGQI